MWSSPFRPHLSWTSDNKTLITAVTAAGSLPGLHTTNYWPYQLSGAKCVWLGVVTHYISLCASVHVQTSQRIECVPLHVCSNADTIHTTCRDLTWQVHSVQSSTVHSSLFLCTMPLWMQAPLWIPMWCLISLFSSVWYRGNRQNKKLQHKVICLFLYQKMYMKDGDMQVDWGQRVQYF